MRIQYTVSNDTKCYVNQPNVTACYLMRSLDPDGQIFVHSADERIILEAFGKEGRSLGYIGVNSLTPVKSEAVVQQGYRNVILHDCDHVEWIKKVTLH